MKKLLERVLGPLGPVRRLPSTLGDEQGAQWGFVPRDQRRALQLFLILLGVVVVANVLVVLALVIFS